MGLEAAGAGDVGAGTRVVVLPGGGYEPLNEVTAKLVSFDHEQDSMKVSEGQVPLQ